jgi:hypothetical protein
VKNLTVTLNRQAARSLFLTLVLSFVNLAGAFVTLTALGGIEPWTSLQFVGLFGAMETALGLAYLFAPNAWRLPVAEANTPDRTQVRLAASTLLIPHWLAAAKTVGGIAMIIYAGASEGFDAGSILLPVSILSIAVAILGLTVAIARLGAARPDLDVFFLVIRRPRREEWELPGLSVTGIAMQLLSNFGIFPAVKLLQPDALFQPQIAPSSGLVLGSVAAAAAGCLLAALAWRGRTAWHAPAEQEREAEAELAGTA